MSCCGLTCLMNFLFLKNNDPYSVSKMKLRPCGLASLTQAFMLQSLFCLSCSHTSSSLWKVGAAYLLTLLNLSCLSCSLRSNIIEVTSTCWYSSGKMQLRTCRL